MRRYSLLLLLFAASLVPGRANLGETIGQIVARYGKPTGYAEAGAKSPFGSLLFKASGYELIIFILNNREVGARVSKLDKSALGEAELKTIMATDTDGSPWVPIANPDPSTKEWSRHDQATALYDEGKNMLLFTSPEMAKAIQAPKP